MAGLVIPLPHQFALAKLGLLPDEDFKILLEFLSAPKRDLVSDRFAEDLVSKLPAYTEEDAQELGGTLTSLYVTLASSNKGGEELAADAVAAIRASSDEDLRRSVKDPGKLGERLQTLLKISALENAAKAFELVNDHQNIFLDCRVITDIRPVFGHNVEEAPVGAVIVHHLKIVHLEGRERKYYYVALDGSDLQELIEALGRAQKKDRSLSKVLEVAKITQIRTDD